MSSSCQSTGSSLAFVRPVTTGGASPVLFDSGSLYVCLREEKECRLMASRWSRYCQAEYPRLVGLEVFLACRILHHGIVAANTCRCFQKQLNHQPVLQNILLAPNYHPLKKDAWTRSSTTD